VKEIQDGLSRCLPHLWFVLMAENGVQIGRRVPGKMLVVQRCIFVDFNGHIEVGVHAKDLPPTHEFWSKINVVPLDNGNVQDFLANILEVVSALRAYEVCIGVVEFEDVWKTAKNAEIDTNPFLEPRNSRCC